MKIFIFYCLLFIHVNMCIYIMNMFIESPYCYYYVAIESGFGFGDELSPESVFGAVLSFDLGCRVRVYRDFTDLNPPRCHPYPCSSFGPTIKDGVLG